MQEQAIKEKVGRMIISDLVTDREIDENSVNQETTYLEDKTDGRGCYYHQIIIFIIK